MKKLLCVCLAAALLCAVSVQALAEEDAHVIRVSGNATVTVAADTATLQIGVTTRKDTVAEAQQENSEIMHRVIRAVLDTGVAENDVITSQFNVFTGRDYGTDEKGNETVREYYEVNNMLSVVVREMSLLGKVLDAGMAAGANQTYGISFSSTKENEAYQKALTRAVEDAQQKAQVLAAAAGKTLGEILVMDASQGGYYYGISNTFKAAADATGSAVVGGDVSVSASVVLAYSFK